MIPKCVESVPEPEADFKIFLCDYREVQGQLFFMATCP